MEMSAEVCRELQPKPNFGSALVNGFGCFIFYIFICPSTYSFTTTNPTLDPCLQLESIFKRFLPLLRTSLAENSLLSFLSEFLSLEIIWSCCLLSLSCGEMPPLSSHKGFSPSRPRPALVGRKTHFVPRGCLSEVSHTLFSKVCHPNQQCTTKHSILFSQNSKRRYNWTKAANQKEVSVQMRKFIFRAISAKSSASFKATIDCTLNCTFLHISCKGWNRCRECRKIMPANSYAWCK